MEWRKLGKDDCGERMSTETMRAVQIDMLNAFADYCDANELRYYLSGGTLLGAVRHKGFIPWDDDIDVNMPRPDCEKLQEMTGGVLGKYLIKAPTVDTTVRCEYWRIYDTETVIENTMGGSSKIPIYHPIFIDIFPIEGLPDSKVRTKWHYMKIGIIRKMKRVASLEHPAGKTIYAHMFHIIMTPLAKIVGYSRWQNMLQKEAIKYKFDDCNYVGVVTAWVHAEEEKMLKADYLPPVEVQFENRTYHAPANYDYYLSSLYGNYMKIPPKRKQVSHHDFTAYWRKK